MIDLRSLRYAVVVADHHSFRKAAIALGAHQSAIGRRVRSLEDALGVSIFERGFGAFARWRLGNGERTDICAAAGL
jgi:DNA-binding transcriptional LysR family regulator